MEIKDIEKLAELAKIELNDKEKEKLLKDLDSILDYVKQIEVVDVKDIEVEYENRNVWREDMPGARDFSKEIITEEFPDSQDGFVKVKKIM
jgi:aspartyl-tRNA(Asn)/glutamyl-tRNA(Gln) amidotransferase subunit C